MGTAEWLMIIIPCGLYLIATVLDYFLQKRIDRLNEEIEREKKKFWTKNINNN